MEKNIKNSLKELGFKSNEIKVYLALTVLGEARASQIAKKAGLPRTTAISILNKLEEDCYLTLHQYKGTNYYWIESPGVISEIFRNKTLYAQNLEESLRDLYRSESKFPTAQIIDTKKGIKNFIEKALSDLKKNSTIYTIDSPDSGNYKKIFSDETEKIFINLKQKKQIITKTLVPFGGIKTITKEKLQQQNIQIKEMPKEINFQASLWFIDSSMIHFSGIPPFITIIKQDKIVESNKSIFDFIWSISN